MPILELLLTHKEFFVILILLMFIGFGFMYIKVLHAENSSLKSANATLSSELVASNNSIKDLQASVDEQNTAINNLKSAADARVQSHAVEIAAANAKAETYRQQAMDILKAKPQTTNNCDSANDLINQEILKNANKK
jgi:hypothetical protein